MGAGGCRVAASFLIAAGVWNALAHVTNEAHHPEHREPVYQAADARAVLLTTATSLEYLATLLSSPTLP